MQNLADRKVLTTTILSGAAISSVIDIGPGYAIVGLDMPSGWDAADIVYECSSTKNSNGTYSPATFQRLQDTSGNVIRITGLAANVCISERALDITARRYVKLRSVAVAGSVDANQTADRIINVIVKSVLG